jgi:hypothetical protein
MNKKQYDAFYLIRNDFKKYAMNISGKDTDEVPVYNEDIDKFNDRSVIKYILLADNPGKEEAVEHRYLIGHSGRQARNFFEANALADNFADEVLVLNKTCLHTNSTSGLRKLKNSMLLAESQKFMAETAFKLHKVLDCEMWIVGCSELHSRGIFSRFRETIADCYAEEKFESLRNKVFCYKHFSYGNFSHDLKVHPSSDMKVKLQDVGTEMRIKHLGW